jgi:hypothetical protein
MMVVPTSKQCNESKLFNTIVNFFKKINNLSNFKKLINLQICLWIELKNMNEKNIEPCSNTT